MVLTVNFGASLESAWDGLLFRGGLEVLKKRVKQKLQLPTYGGPAATRYKDTVPANRGRLCHLWRISFISGV